MRGACALYVGFVKSKSLIKRSLILAGSLSPFGSAWHNLSIRFWSMAREENSKWKRLKEILEDSSISGLPKIVKAKHLFPKLFWTALLIGGIVGFAVNMYYLTYRFLSEPVLNIQVAEYEKFIWPEIVICNPMNPIRYYNTSKWEELRNRTKRFHKLRYGHKKMLHYSHTILMSSINPHEFRLSETNRVIPFWKMYYDEPGITAIPNPFHSNGFTVLDVSHFETRQNVMLFPFPCYSLSTRKQPVLVKKERFKVLRKIVLPISTTEEDYKKFECHTDDRGVHLYVIPVNGTIPYRRTALLSSGSKVKASVKMHRKQRLKSKTNCTDSKFHIELYDATFSTYRKFQGTFADCKSFVTQRIYLRECNCYNPFLPIHRTDQYPPRLCLNLTLFSDSEITENLKCLQNTFNRYLVNKSDFLETLERECDQFKHPPCQELTYEVNLETSEMSENVNRERERYVSNIAEYLPGLQSGDSLEKIKRNVLLLSVMKSTNFGSYSSQEPEYEAAQFISDIGGIVGLWIGLSVVGFFEIFEIIAVAIQVHVYRNAPSDTLKTSNEQQPLAEDQNDCHCDSQV